MQFFSTAVTTLQTLVVALGAGLAVWGVVNLLEGYGSDNAAAKSQGIKQLMAGGGIILPVGPVHTVHFNQRHHDGPEHHYFCAGIWPHD